MDRHTSPVSHSERLDPAPPAHRKAAAGRRPVENSGKAHDALPPLASSHVKYIRGSSSSPCRDAGNKIPRAATSTALQWVQASRSRGGSGQQDSSFDGMVAALGDAVASLQAAGLEDVWGRVRHALSDLAGSDHRTLSLHRMADLCGRVSPVFEAGAAACARVDVVLSFCIALAPEFKELAADTRTQLHDLVFCAPPRLSPLSPRLDAADVNALANAYAQFRTNKDQGGGLLRPHAEDPRTKVIKRVLRNTSRDVLSRVLRLWRAHTATRNEIRGLEADKAAAAEELAAVHIRLAAAEAAAAEAQAQLHKARSHTAQQLKEQKDGLLAQIAAGSSSLQEAARRAASAEADIVTYREHAADVAEAASLLTREAHAALSALKAAAADRVARARKEGDIYVSGTHHPVRTQLVQIVADRPKMPAALVLWVRTRCAGLWYEVFDAGEPESLFDFAESLGVSATQSSVKSSCHIAALADTKALLLTLYTLTSGKVSLKQIKSCRDAMGSLELLTSVTRRLDIRLQTRSPADYIAHTSRRIAAVFHTGQAVLSLASTPWLYDANKRASAAGSPASPPAEHPSLPPPQQQPDDPAGGHVARKNSNRRRASIISPPEPAAAPGDAPWAFLAKDVVDSDGEEGEDEDGGQRPKRAASKGGGGERGRRASVADARVPSLPADGGGMGCRKQSLLMSRSPSVAHAMRTRLAGLDAGALDKDAARAFTADMRRVHSSIEAVLDHTDGKLHCTERLHAAGDALSSGFIAHLLEEASGSASGESHAYRKSSALAGVVAVDDFEPVLASAEDRAVAASIAASHGKRLEEIFRHYSCRGEMAKADAVAFLEDARIVAPHAFDAGGRGKGDKTPTSRSPSALNIARHDGAHSVSASVALMTSRFTEAPGSLSDFVVFLAELTEAGVVKTIPKSRSFGERLSLLFSEHVIPHALFFSEDEMTACMSSEGVAQVLAAHRVQLGKLFATYGVVQDAGPSGRKVSTRKRTSRPDSLPWTASGFRKLAEDYRLFDDGFSPPALHGIYRRLAPPGDETFRFSDFAAALLTIACHKYPAPYVPNHQKLQKFITIHLSQKDKRRPSHRKDSGTQSPI